MLSRVLLFNFLNIPFVRLHSYYFLSDKERLAWLNRQIQFGRIVRNSGTSMYPTLTGDPEFIFVSRYSKAIYPRVGDVVTLRDPNRTDKAWVQKRTEHRDLCKRIVGFEGYCGYKETGWRGVPASKVIVPRGYCWALGDNRSISRDSRRFGPVPFASLVGKVIWRLGPDGFNFIDHSPGHGITSQSPISPTRQPIWPDAAPQSPGSPAILIFETITPATKGPKARLRYSVSRTKGQESVGRSSSKKA